MQRFYGEPTDEAINEFEIEIIELLKNGLLGTVKYGFYLDGDFIEPTLIYTARSLEGVNASDDDPGRVRPNANISGASFYSYLTYSSAWSDLSEEEKKNFKDSLPFQRTNGSEPRVNGYIENDKTYSSGGRALDRSSVRSY